MGASSDAVDGGADGAGIGDGGAGSDTGGGRARGVLGGMGQQHPEIAIPAPTATARAAIRIAYRTPTTRSSCAAHELSLTPLGAAG